MGCSVAIAGAIACAVVWCGLPRRGFTKNLPPFVPSTNRKAKPSHGNYTVEVAMEDGVIP